MTHRSEEGITALAQDIVNELSSRVEITSPPDVRLWGPGDDPRTAMADLLANEIWINGCTQDWPGAWLRGLLAHEVGHFVSAPPRRHLVVGFYPALALATVAALFIKPRWAVLLPGSVSLLSEWALWYRLVEAEKSADITAAHIEPCSVEYREAVWKRGKWPSRKAQLLSLKGPHQSRRRRYANTVRHAVRANCGCPSIIAPRQADRVRIALRAQWRVA